MDDGRPVRGGALRVAFLEPFHGGSHRAAALGWARHSRHRVRVVGLSARAWKWRMRGAAFALARRLAAHAHEVDAVVASGLLDLAHLKALLPRRLPLILYLHENQLTYPPRGEPSEGPDLQYAFTNLASALAADRVAFNSAAQAEAFFPALEALLRRMPAPRVLWAVDAVRAKSVVLPLGVELSDLPPPSERSPGARLVLWNHRWEYDKGPEAFFGALFALAERGIPFRVAVAGQSFRRSPPVFGEARDRLGARVVHWGHVGDRRAYLDLLSRADVVVSTAVHETFGLSLVEAACAGAHPLAPARLSYPEVIPSELWDRCLFAEDAALPRRLEALLTGREALLSRARLRQALGPHRWEARAAAFDDLVSQVSGEVGV